MKNILRRWAEKKASLKILFLLSCAIPAGLIIRCSSSVEVIKRPDVDLGCGYRGSPYAKRCFASLGSFYDGWAEIAQTDSCQNQVILFYEPVDISRPIPEDVLVKADRSLEKFISDKEAYMYIFNRIAERREVDCIKIEAYK